MLVEEQGKLGSDKYTLRVTWFAAALLEEAPRLSIGLSNDPHVHTD